MHRSRRHVPAEQTHTGPASNVTATAPGRLKAPGTPAQGKALGAGELKARGAHRGRVKAAPASTKTKNLKAPKPAPPAAKTPPGQSAAGPPGQAPKPASHATQAPPGQSPAGPPGQARKQSDSAPKQP